MKNQALQNIQNLNSQNFQSCTQTAQARHCERESAKQSLDSQISESNVHFSKDCHANAHNDENAAQTPQISIVIPVYNAQPYITRCLESLVNQTYKNIQIIIVDDCGADDSIQVAKDFVQKYYALKADQIRHCERDSAWQSQGVLESETQATKDKDCFAFARNDKKTTSPQQTQNRAPITEITSHFSNACNDEMGAHQPQPYFTFIHNPTNLGTFHARAAGIRNASAPYIMFADPDDFLAPKACAVMLHTITKTNAHMVQARMSYHPKTLLRVRHNVHIGKLYDHRMRAFLSIENNTQGLWDKIFRTDIMQQALQDLNFMQPPLNMLEDGLLVFVYSMRASVYVGVRDNIYFYCHNPNSITKDRSVQNFYKKMAHIQKHFDSTARLAALYKDFENLNPQDAQYLLSKYRAKIASTLAVDTRHYDEACFEKTLATLAENGFTKKPNGVKSVYLKCVLLSLRYAYRWQNLARVVMFVFSFGKVKN